MNVYILPQYILRVCNIFNSIIFLGDIDGIQIGRMPIF